MSNAPEQEIDRFSKQMEDRFMRDLENIQIGDQDSELQASSDFYEGLKKKLNSHITQIKASTTKNTILEQLKANINKEMDNVQKYEEQIKQMKHLNTVKQSAITQQKIQQIKNRIAKQNINQSKIILADEEVELKQKQQSRVFFQNVQFEDVQQGNNTTEEKHNNNTKTKKFQKKQKASSLSNAHIQKKILLANLERQRIHMQREDELSMKYQYQVMSQFFKERFIDVKIPKLDPIKPTIKISFNKPKTTFTNLAPLPNNQKNVLPKNSPQIALKALKKNRRTSLIPVSQTTVKIQFKRISHLDSNINNQDETKKVFDLQKNKQSQNAKNNQFSNLISSYLNLIKSPINELKKATSQYKPKFIKSHLSQNQKISNIDVAQVEGGQRSLETIISENEIQNQVNPKKLKQFKLTFEKITNLKGIQRYESIELVALQYNMIKNVNQINLCKKLIQLNFSNNCIKETKSIESLPELRYLNLSYNKVRQFSFLGSSLEILNLKNNQVQIIMDLNRNRYLRIIDLTDNKLHSIGKGFSQLYFLQELLLEKNYLQSITGIQQLIMLQRLNLAHNRLSQIDKSLMFIFLNNLDLSYNQLVTAPSMFLPSLQRLYITNNKITGDDINKSIIYLPQLKQFNIDDNEIKGFSLVWFFVRFSKKLQMLKYDSNEYFLSVRQKVRELYEAIIYRNMKNLKILNLSPADSGIKAYYQSVYSSYLKRGNKLQTIDKEFTKLQQFISFLLKQNKIISNLEDQTNKYRNQRFTQLTSFIQSKSVKRVNFLDEIVKMLTQKYIKMQNYKQKKQKKQNQNKENLTLIPINNHIYYLHDQYQSDFLQKIHKIKSLFHLAKYKKQKRLKYFKSKQIILLSLFTDIEQIVTKNQLIKVIRRFSVALRQNKQEDAVIFIQKMYRGYRSRKLFKKLMKKLKQNQDDSFEMEQVDLDDFEPNKFLEFNFQLPDDINFQEYIIQPKYFEVAADQTKKRASKTSNQLPSITEKQQQYRPVMNNYIDEENKKQQKSKKKQNDQKLMKQWGFQNPASLQALRWKKKRKDQMKRKQAQLNMTAAQRYQKFKNIHK